MNSPRKSYAQSPKMAWLYNFSVERTFTTCHVSLFWPSNLKKIQRKLQYVLFLWLLMKFQSDAQRESYNDFSKVTCLECNLRVCKNPSFLRSYLRKYIETRFEIWTGGSKRFPLKWVFLAYETSQKKVIAKIPRWPVLDEII